MTGITHAPWTPEQFTNISLWQTTPWVHPLTCGTDGCRTTLAVSSQGLECPNCDYTQTWVPSLVAERGPPPDPRELLKEYGLKPGEQGTLIQSFIDAEIDEHLKGDDGDEPA